MEQLSQALNLGPQPMQSVYSSLHHRTLKSISRKNRLYLYGVDTLAKFSETARGGSEACQRQKSPLWRRARRCAGKPKSYQKPPASLRFSHKTASTVRKIVFIVRNGQSRAMNKPKTNSLWEWLPADCMITSLANIKTLCRRLSAVHRPLAVLGTKKQFEAIALENSYKLSDRRILRG